MDQAWQVAGVQRLPVPALASATGWRAFSPALGAEIRSTAKAKPAKRKTLTELLGAP